MAFYLLRASIRKLPGKVIRAVPMPSPCVHEGCGARERIGEICAERGYRRALIVTDGRLSSLGYLEKITSSLEERGITYAVYDGIASEPKTEYIEEGRAAAEKIGAECLITLGGGSVLDTGKMIAAGVKKKRRRAGALLRKFLFVRGGTLPVIAVPTTAGTGAEITVGAVVTRKNGKKGATVVCGLRVGDIVLDSELSLHMPLSVSAACGIDALSHGLEGVLAAVRYNEEDMQKSTGCVRLVLENLPVLLNEPENEPARRQMCRAALWGGNAINKQLAGYVHAFAHTIGARYHIPHGEAIALSLLPVVTAKKEKCREKLAHLAVGCGITAENTDPMAAADAMCGALRELIGKCGFAPRGAFMPEKDYRFLARAIEADSINYSAPYTLKRKEIYAILDEINGKGETAK